MAINSLGDMSRSIMMRNANHKTKSALQLHSYEMTTGLKRDIPAALRGQTAHLGHIEARLTALESYKQAGQEMAVTTASMQLVLDGMQGKAMQLGKDLVIAASHASGPNLNSATEQALSHLGDAISQINTRIGGRYLFAGTQSDHPPLPSADEIMDTVRNLLLPTDTPQDAIATINAFFDAAAGTGGFTDQLYNGGQSAMTAAIAPSHQISITANGNSPAIRETLKGLTLMALSREAPYDGNTALQAVIVDAAGQTLINADTKIALLRGDLGTSEAAIEIAQSRNAAESATLSLSRNKLISADLYEAASALAEAEARMEAIYSLTARLSRMSLAAYL